MRNHFGSFERTRKSTGLSPAQDKSAQDKSAQCRQTGAAPILILVAIIGVVAFLAISSSAPFRDNLLSSLFPKEQSQAATFDPNTRTFSETFNGAPTSPKAITQRNQNEWDIQTHSRDSYSWPDGQLPPMDAQHGMDCGAPPATHRINDYEQTVFNCRDHLMTAIDGSAGYALITLTPNHVLDCTALSCSVQWDMSTERMSGRDWPDLWITPWADNLTLPFEDDGADLQGFPKNTIVVSMGNGQTAPVISVVKNKQSVFANYYGGPHAPSIQQGITPGTNQSATRQTFKLTLTPTSAKLERLASATAPYLLFWDYNQGFVEENGTVFPQLALTNSMTVQFGHHSYTPFKDNAGVAATWHWDNIQLTPSAPFTMIKADRRFVNQNGQVVKFNLPAPANSFIRFTAACAPRINGGPALTKQTSSGHPEHQSSYFSPITAGTQEFTFTFTNDDWYTGPCIAKDFAIWSQTASASPAPSIQPSASPSPSPISSPPPASGSPTPAASVKPGDIDGNNKVDIFDYNVLLTNFGQTTPNNPADLDKNGKVDIFDFNILLTNFGK